MKIRFWTSFFVGISPFLLTACGGGGGSDSGSGSIGDSDVYLFTSASALRANGTAVLSGSAETANYEVVNGSTTITNETSGSSTLNLEAKNGATTKLALTAPAGNSSVNLQKANGDDLIKIGTLNSWTKRNGDDTALFEGQYEYQTFGVWQTGRNSGSGTIGSGSYGAATSNNRVPTGSATYSGNSIGTTTDVSGKIVATTSTVTATTDFRDIDLLSTNTQAGIIGPTTPRPDLDFEGSGTVNGASFDMNIGNVAGSGLSGTATGKFYGPNAQEIGGTFSAGGYIGSFGGERP
ncbi:hypothetical protein SuNHUV7_21520 (plasmid) [Pseudoseohaeicola sp. NH-UV-7]|uniref:transferrin-binding protein-like solute binding protein n=1 Tax=Sulfitobacter sp. TBRI5 TaxID=2989732 RepID=UPI003A5E3256